MILVQHVVRALVVVGSLFLITAACSVNAKEQQQNGSTATTCRAHRLTYLGRLDEDTVHSYGVRKLWSSTRHESPGQRRHEHDPGEKRSSRMELLRKTIDTAVSHLFVTVLSEVLHSSHDDQLWVMHQKKKNALFDLEPDCRIKMDDHDDEDEEDDEDEDEDHDEYDDNNDDYLAPLVCTVQFRSLEVLYGVSWSLAATLTTKPLSHLPSDEIRRRLETQGRTRPVEFCALRLVATLLAPDDFLGGGEDVHSSLSERALRGLVKKIQNFVAVADSQSSVTTEHLGTKEILTMHRDEWESLLEDDDHQPQLQLPTSNHHHHHSNSNTTASQHECDLEEKAGTESHSNQQEEKVVFNDEASVSSQMEKNGLGGLDLFLLQEEAKERAGAVADTIHDSTANNIIAHSPHDEL